MWKKVLAGMGAGGFGQGSARLQNVDFSTEQCSIFSFFQFVIFLRSCDAFCTPQLVASPTDLIKTHMQMEGRRRLQGKKPRVEGMMDAARYIRFKKKEYRSILERLC